MGKRIRAQRKGSTLLVRSSNRSVAPAFIPNFDSPMKAKVVELLHNPGRGTPIAKIKADNGDIFYLNAIEGMYVGQEISIYGEGPPSIGDIRRLKDIPPGTIISHVEKVPGDGGKFARSSGAYAQVIGPSGDGIEVLLPSGKSVVVDPNARAIIGNIAAGGRIDKPFLKAGKKYHWLKAKAPKRWPIVRGVAMNPVDHKFGGGSHQHVGKPKTVSRHAPPGAKVGSFGARRTGRRKK